MVAVKAAGYYYVQWHKGSGTLEYDSAGLVHGPPSVSTSLLLDGDHTA